MNIRCSITYSLSPYRNTLWAPREHCLLIVEKECTKTYTVKPYKYSFTRLSGFISIYESRTLDSGACQSGEGDEESSDKQKRPHSHSLSDRVVRRD